MKNRISKEEWQNLSDNFETTDLLSAIEAVDVLRGYLSDDESCAPPQIRTDILRLHQLAMEVVNQGVQSKIIPLFELAADIEVRLDEIAEKLDEVRETLSELMQLYPESLDDFD